MGEEEGPMGLRGTRNTAAIALAYLEVVFSGGSSATRFQRLQTRAKARPLWVISGSHADYTCPLRYGKRTLLDRPQLYLTGPYFSIVSHRAERQTLVLCRTGLSLPRAGRSFSVRCSLFPIGLLASSLSRPAFCW